MARNFTRAQRLLMLRKSGYCCANCGVNLTLDNFAADHRIPYSKGGATQAWNGQALCITCNSQKGDKWEGLSNGDR
ncbi:HNH endonuclease [Gloeothece verrucosa]|uniref:HNH endonuclease n=1 Tax=Gloeothece verrucosa TaxID=2546359 RepID=UPI000301145F|nr:HNH endonuclease signature motif containing protein [Gloeothece verrucosa]